MTIDLNGHTLTAPENSKAFWIRNGALTIEDSIGGGVIQGSGTVNDTPSDAAARSAVLTQATARVYIWATAHSI